MNKEEFLLKAQVYYYKFYGYNDLIFELLDDEVKKAIVEDHITDGVISYSHNEFKFMIKNSKYFTEYLKYSIYEAGEELTDDEFNLLSDEQKLEYCEIVEKCYIEDEDEGYGGLKNWYRHPLYIWYSAFKREQLIKSVLDE